MFNFKKPLAFITGIICSTICLHHCSALERNKLGIITALTKDATIEKKISEACLAYEEYAERLNAKFGLVKRLMYEPYGTVISYDTNDTDINTYYDEIVKGNFGLKWVVMHYIARLLNEAGIRADLWCFYDGKFKPSASANCKDISDLIYHCLVVYRPDGETLHTFDFNINNDDNGLDTDPKGFSVSYVYSRLIDAFKKDGVTHITTACIDPATGEFRPLPPEIVRAGTYSRAMYDQPNIDKKSYENVFYFSQKGKIKHF